MKPGANMHRRNFLAGSVSAAASTSINSAQARPLALRDAASARNIRFGSQVTVKDILADHAYAELIARECEIITPGLEAKWAYTEPSEGNFTLAPMDQLRSYAASHNLQLHMHNLIWSVGLPRWVIAAIAEGREASVMARHIRALMSRYKEGVDSWDVINEPADPRWPSGPEGLCTTPWRNGLGPAYVDRALRDAASESPNARLMINDDDLEYEGPDRDRKRSIYLRLIESLRRNDVALGGFGLEAHLKPWLTIAEDSYRRFLRELAGLGLAIYVTELDVCDRTLPADVESRDGCVARFTKRYLDIVLDEPATCAVITWGLSDRTSWMLHDPTAQRRDKLAPRPLPYDAQLVAKPMRGAIMSALQHAPDRPRPRHRA
jgi:endo-1,4-beta-xylanase